jgi:AP endonuclease 1
MSGPSESSSLSDLDSDELLPPPLPNKPLEPKPKAVRVRKCKSTAATTTTTVTNGTATTTTTTTVETTDTEAISTETPPKQKRQRKKKEKEPLMPLAPRVPSLLKIGAHVSAAKGVYNSVTNAVHIGFVSPLRVD